MLNPLIDVYVYGRCLPFSKKPLVGFDSGDTYDCLREHFTFPRLLVAQPLLV